MARHLLDSDVLIWVLRGKPLAVDFVGGLLTQEIPAISSLSVYEIWLGARAGEQETIADFLAAFDILPVTLEIAKQSASYYKEFRAKGLTLSMADAFIAGTARLHQLVLVTQNQRDFPMADVEKKSL